MRAPKPDIWYRLHRAGTNLNAMEQEARAVQMHGHGVHGTAYVQQWAEAQVMCKRLVDEAVAALHWHREAMRHRFRR